MAVLLSQLIYEDTFVLSQKAIKTYVINQCCSSYFIIFLYRDQFTRLTLRFLNSFIAGVRNENWMKPFCNLLSAYREWAFENGWGAGRHRYERVMKKRSPSELCSLRTRCQINVSRTVSPYDVDVEKWCHLTFDCNRKSLASCSSIAHTICNWRISKISAKATSKLLFSLRETT